MRGSPRVLPSSEPSANLPNTESLMEPKQRPHAGPHLLLQVPVLSASPGLTGSPQPVTRQSSHPRQLCPDAAMAPWALLCPLGPCRCPPEVWVRTQLQRGAQGHPTHLPGGTSPPVLQMGKQAQRSRVTHPRSHTGKWYKQETHPLYFVLLPPTSIYGALAVPQGWVIRTSTVPTCIPLQTGARRGRRRPTPRAGCWGGSWHSPNTPGALPRFPVQTHHPVHWWVALRSQPWCSTCSETWMVWVEWEVGWGGQETSR